jgi:hypothetical protein
MLAGKPVGAAMPQLTPAVRRFYILGAAVAKGDAIKLLLAATLLLAPAVAGAQSYINDQPTMNMPNYSTLQSSTEGLDPLPRHESPAVKQEKLARAIALRDEVLVLEAPDGGTLSRDSQAYLRRKARAILAYRG